MAQRKVTSQETYIDPSKVGSHMPAGTTSVHVGIQDAHWFCNSCGNTEPIDGNKKICPKCGNPKDKSENYVAPTDDHAFLTESELKQRGVDEDHGSDEECPYCQAKIAPKTQICPQCNGTIINVGKTSRICPTCSRESNTSVCPSCGNKTVSKSEQLSSDPPSPPSSNFYQVPGDEQPNRTTPWFLIVGLVAAIAIVVVGIVLIFSPMEKAGTVVSNSWSCSVPMQEYQYNQHGDWSVPVGGDYLSEHQKIHHYDQVYLRTDRVCTNNYEVVGSHSEYKGTTRICYDDGTCDTDDIYETVSDYGYVEHCNDVPIYDQVPRYATWYEYKIWEWVSISPLVSSGSDNTIVCPVAQETDTLKQSADPNISCQTTFQVDKKQRTAKPDCDSEFPNYTNTSQWNLTMTGPFIKAISPLP